MSTVDHLMPSYTTRTNLTHVRVMVIPDDWPCSQGVTPYAYVPTYALSRFSLLDPTRPHHWRANHTVPGGLV